MKWRRRMNSSRFEFLRQCIAEEGKYWYLAGPYSGNEDYNHSEHERALFALLKAEVWTYSPIVHCHALAHKYKLPTNAAFWQQYNEVMIQNSFGLIVYELPNWQKSK